MKSLKFAIVAHFLNDILYLGHFYTLIMMNQSIYERHLEDFTKILPQRTDDWSPSDGYPLAFLNMRIRENRWECLRMLILAPFLEECVFRVVFFGALKSTGYSNGKTILITAAFFSLAHCHFAILKLVEVAKEVHAVRLALAKTVFRAVLAKTILTMAYTFIFGLYSGYIYIQTGGSFWAVFALHLSCNAMNLPVFNARAGLERGRPATIYQTLRYWGVYLFGIGAFFTLMYNFQTLFC